MTIQRTLATKKTNNYLNPILRTMRLSFFAIILILSFVFRQSGYAALPESKPTISDSSVIISFGSSEIKKDIPKAKQNAVNDALNRSFEKIITKMLTPAEISDNLEFISSTLLAGNPDRYISTYKIIGEAKASSNYTVAVETSFNTELLEQFLKEKSLIISDIQLPEVMLFISEKRPEDSSPRFWWGSSALPYNSITEKKIASVLKENNYKLAGDLQKRPDPEQLGIFFTSVYDTEASIALARKLQADIVVTGTALAEEDSNVMGDEKSYTGRVELDIYSVSSGMKLAVLSKDAVARSMNNKEGLDSSLEMAGETSGQALASIIKNSWQQQGSDFKTIKAKIEGSDYLSSFIMLRKTLNSMSNIKDVQTRELSSEQAIVDILFKGNGKTLANTLMLKRFDTFGLELSEVTEESLTIRFIPKSDETPIEKSDMEGAYISE
ncbi:conserved exported hypothetical protein [Desulfamplus magnetovallimortis]|uniref:Flagellar assembly protein T N-terminal domain-containing protein n=1 Tax=Desulfamplus magnetovallimortis TaxID=1246637 RepID=A0A1W1H5D6_9BACT|nr:hypothetical protein [Desulfamplus magnetovallimortis]SLM27693.1 conserved exported hypothetical protein [Desulfamplus magnetovallimortis]